MFGKEFMVVRVHGRIEKREPHKVHASHRVQQKSYVSSGDMVMCHGGGWRSFTQ